MSSDSSSVPTEFVADAFETTVTEAEIDRLIEAIDDTISNLRGQIDDDTLENILRADAGSYQLNSSMTQDGLQPESFTQDAVINPLLDSLGHTYSTEAGGLSGGQTQVADYTVSLRDHPEIDSTRLLIEAEPINKALDSRKHGVGQVRDWLSQREFESDFGFATDGLRWIFVRYDPDSYTLNVIEEVDLQPVFLALFENQVGTREDPTDAVFDADRDRVGRLIRTFEYDNFVSIAGEARRVIKEKKEEITDEFYDDYIRYVFGIVGDDEETARSLVGDGVVVPEAATEDDARLFAVELMNRLVFIKFLEDKALVQPDLLTTLKTTYENGMYAGSFYEEFCQPLFYDVMNNRSDDRPESVQNIDLFDDIPYLNGGLFRPTISGDEFDEDEFDVRNSVLFSIVDLLERYSFSAEGAPTDLDPSVLGNVFEKTINYITSDNADTNKELGAYYTPSEITRFSAEETVRPALLDRFQTVLVEECDWPEHEAERFDSVYELIEGLPGHMGTIGPLLDEVDEFRVVDPACGSGHFLTSVLEEIVNIRKALYAQNESYPDEYRLKKTTVLNNIYGVDLMGPAVEIAKLRCWLSVISELETENVDDLADDDALALPNIAFNLREGNSLIGYTGFPETNGDDQYRLGSFNEDSVRDRYQDIIEEIEKHEQAIDSEIAEKHRRNAFEKLRNAREELIDDIHADFVEAGVGDITPEEISELQPFNWVLEFAEVYADGGFDVIVGNPPWDVLRTNRDDYFSRHDPRFRTRMPEDKDKKMEELLEDPKIEKGWEQYNHQMQARADYFNNSDEYELQSPVVDGKEVTSENELSALFLERVYNIARDDAYISLILPNVIFTSSTAKDLRLHLLNNTRVDSLLHFENHGIFDGLHNQYRFGILTFQNSGQTKELRGIFLEKSIDVIEEFEEKTVKIPREVLTNYSPEAALFPQISSRGDTNPENEVGVLSKLLDHPSLSDSVEDSWNVSIHRELDRTYDTDRFVESSGKGDYPVLGGKNIYQFVYDDSFLDVEPPEFWSVNEEKSTERSAKSRIREKEVRNLKTALYNQFEGSGSQKKFVNDLLEDTRGEPLSKDDVRLDCTNPRIAFRDIGNTTNERTFIAAVLPTGVVCHSKLRTFRPYKINAEESDLTEFPLQSIYQPRFTEKEMFAAVGLINSLPFDYLMRTKIDNTLVAYKVRESQVPRLTNGDEWFDYIWQRAARLNCYGDDFESLRKKLNITPVTSHQDRKQTQAEIDAGSMHAYGLNRSEAKHILDNFGRVENSRLMDDVYFEMVLEKYDAISRDSESEA
jgi:type I restriction-modification system DNA methylase subunit